MLWNGTAFNFETVMDVGRCILDSRQLKTDESRHTTINCKLELHHWRGRIAMTG